MSTSRPAARGKDRLQAGACLVLAVTLTSPIRAETTVQGLDPTKALTQLGLDTWTTDHGLPNATVNDVRETRDGYVWLATYDGLARFDGTRFAVFGKKDGLGSNGIRVLCEDDDGNLWVGTNGGGLARYAHGRFTRFTTEQGLPSNIVWSLRADRRDGSLWVGTNGGGLARYRAGRFETFPIAESGRVIYSIAQAEDGTIWLGTQAEGLRRQTPDGRWTAFTTGDGLPRGLVTSVLPMRDGTLWAGSSGGLFRIVGDRVAPLPASLEELAATNISSLVEDGAGTLWVGTNGRGVARVAGGRADFLGSSDGLGDVVYSLHLDRAGTLWIGTNGAGMARLRDGSFTTYAKREGLSRDFVYSVLEDRGGTLWVGTAAGLDRLGPSGFEPASPPLDPPVGARSMVEGPDGTLWLGTYGAGLWKLTAGTWSAFSTRDGLASDTVRAILLDGDDRVLAATQAGLSVLEAGVWRSYGLADGLPMLSLIGLARDREGSVWIGTDGGGLVRLREGVFRTFTTKDGLASDLVLTLFVDTHGVLWVGTNGGLSRRTPRGFVSYTTAAGLPSDAVTQIVEDAAGDLWLGSSRGVSRARRASLDSGAAVLEIETFDRLDGMKSSQCTAPGQPGAMRDRNGRLWFATTRGVASVDPTRLRQDPWPPAVVVEEVLINGEAVPSLSGVEVPPGSARLELRYAVLAPLGPRRTTVRFRLSGFDPDWVAAGDRRRADYTNLPPGSYVFQTAARTGKGDWRSSAVEIPVRVRPRFYQKPLFALVAVLALAGLVVLGHRRRVSRLQASESELAHLVEERTSSLAAQKERAEKSQARSEMLLAERESAEAALRLQGAYLASLHETALAVMDRLELDPLLHALVERASALLESRDGFLYLETPDRARLECRVFVGSRPRDQYAEADEGAVGRAWKTGEIVAIHDYDTWPFRSPQVPPKTFGAMLAVPLRFGGHVRGALGVAHASDERAFGEDERRLLASFGQLASLALDNASLFAREREAREAAERLEAATRALSSTIDRNAVIDLILVELEKVVPYDSASIQELRGEGLQVIAGRGHAARAVGRSLDPASGDGRSRDVLDGRGPVIRQAAPYADGTFATKPEAGHRSWLGVPLLFGDRVIGMLALNKREPGFYTEPLAQRAAAFAAQAAVAIENARLYGAVQDELAERTRAQQELARSETRYRDLFEHSPGLVCTHDLQGIILSVNPAAAAALGRRPDELVGHSLDEFMPPDIGSRFPQYLQSLGTQGGMAGTLVILDARGGRRTWRYRNVVRDTPETGPFVIGFAQDVTDEETAQRALRESELRFRQLAENIDAVFFIRGVDPPEFLYMSPAYERIWGRPVTRSVETLLESAHPADRETLAAAVARQRGGYDVEYRILRPDGALRWIRSRTFPISDSRGRVSRVAGIAEDVTARKLVEQMREDLTHTLVHDLRNPLTSILVSMDLLETSLSGLAAPSGLEVVRVARRGAIRLRGLVDTILDVSRLEQGAMPLEMAPVVVAEVIDEAFEVQRPMAQPQGLRLVSEVPGDLPRAFADRGLLSRILQNLVGNAVKFTPGGGEIRVRARALPQEPGTLELEVADSGPGIPDDVRERLFEKFVTGRQKGRGSGLGLLFCRLAVEAHGGRIHAENRASGGARFAFTLPEAKANA